MSAGPLEGRIGLPAAVAARMAGEPVVPVWRNELGGLTWRVGDGPGRRFVEWAPAGSGLDLAAEAVRLAWAAPYTAVPEVLDLGGDADGSWLVTTALSGESAASARWRGSTTSSSATGMPARPTP